MHRVLMPIDENVERGLTQATYLTDQPLDPDGVEVVIMHILERVEDDVPEAMRSPTRVDAVRQVRDHLEDHGYAVAIEGAERAPAAAIEATAADVDADQIVMGGRKRSPAGKVLFGSVTQSVLLNTDLPVVVTGGG
ncbi:universal stress protein [Halobacteriales archaeon Cl-PHB]